MKKANNMILILVVVSGLNGFFNYPGNDYNDAYNSNNDYATFLMMLIMYQLI